MFSTCVEVILLSTCFSVNKADVLYMRRGDLFSIFLEVILVALSQPFFCRNVFVGVVGWVKFFVEIFCRPIFFVERLEM